MCADAIDTRSRAPFHRSIRGKLTVFAVALIAISAAALPVGDHFFLREMLRGSGSGNSNSAAKVSPALSVPTLGCRRSGSSWFPAGRDSGSFS